MGMIPKQAIDTSGRAEKSLIERERERWKVGYEMTRGNPTLVNVWEGQAGPFKKAYDNELKVRLGEEKERMGYVDALEKAGKRLESLSNRPTPGLNQASSIASAQAAYAKAKEDRDLYLERLKMEEVLKKPKGGKFYPDPEITADREDPFRSLRRMEAGQLIPEFNRPIGGMMPR